MTNVSEAQKGQVYLIRADNNLYKIGLSADVKRRLQGLRATCACDLELLGEIDTEDMYALEGVLHALFVERRDHGEWFVLSESEVQYILNLSEQDIRKLLEARRRRTAQRAAQRILNAGTVPDLPEETIPPRGENWQSWVYEGVRNPLHDI